MPPPTRRDFLAKSAATAATAMLWPGLDSAIALTSVPHLQFPVSPRERIAVASYPFREVIAGAHEKPYPSTISKMDLKNFVGFVKSEFNINKIEPWSEHFRSLDAKYLNDLRGVVEKSGGAIVNIAADGEHSPYAADKAEREKAVAFSKQWIDIAAAVGSPSVRTNMPPAKDSKPDLDRAAESLVRVAEYGSVRNILVNLENDNPVSEDPFFIVSLIERVNSPWLHTNPDFANSLTTGKTEYAYKGIAAMFQQAYSICHVKALEAGEKGQLFHVDLRKTFGILKTSNYKGYCSMEFDSPGDAIRGTSGLIEETLKFLA